MRIPEFRSVTNPTQSSGTVSTSSEEANTDSPGPSAQAADSFPSFSEVTKPRIVRS